MYYQALRNPERKDCLFIFAGLLVIISFSVRSEIKPVKKEKPFDNILYLAYLQRIASLYCTTAAEADNLYISSRSETLQLPITTPLIQFEACL